MYKKAKYILIAAWLLISIFFLVEALGYKRIDFNSEVRQLFYLKMILISAPCGYIARLLVWLFTSFYSISMGIKFELFLNWVFMVLGGYFQWFVFVPFLVMKIKKAFIKTR